MQWTQPVKLFAGVSGTVTVPSGSVVLAIRAIGNGSIQGVPDGQGGAVTITIPNASQWFEYTPGSWNIRCINAGGLNWTFNFVGTTAYMIEIGNSGGGC